MDLQWKIPSRGSFVCYHYFSLVQPVMRIYLCTLALVMSWCSHTVCCYAFENCTVIIGVFLWLILYYIIVCSQLWTIYILHLQVKSWENIFSTCPAGHTMEATNTTTYRYLQSNPKAIRLFNNFDGVVVPVWLGSEFFGMVGCAVGSSDHTWENTANDWLGVPSVSFQFPKLQLIRTCYTMICNC